MIIHHDNNHNHYNVDNNDNNEIRKSKKREIVTEYPHSLLIECRYTKLKIYILLNCFSRKGIIIPTLLYVQTIHLGCALEWYFLIFVKKSKTLVRS